MKRYLTSYSKGVLNIRDRLTDNTKRISFLDQETADIYQDAVKSTNYNINKSKHSKVTIKSIYDIDINQTKKTSKIWGEILPSEIKWESEYLREKEEKKQLELNKILFGD